MHELRITVDWVVDRCAADTPLRLRDDDIRTPNNRSMEV